MNATLTPNAKLSQALGIEGAVLVDAEGKVRGWDFGGYVVVEWTGQGPNGCAVNVRDCEGGNMTADGLSIEERDALIAAIYANPIDDVDWPDVPWTTVTAT